MSQYKFFYKIKIIFFQFVHPKRKKGMRMMRNNKMILLVMIVLPWLTVPFLGKLTIKRFYPGALFISVWVFFESIIAEKRHGGGCMRSSSLM
jgi:hypothetical protein